MHAAVVDQRPAFDRDVLALEQGRRREPEHEARARLPPRARERKQALRCEVRVLVADRPGEVHAEPAGDVDRSPGLEPQQLARAVAARRLERPRPGTEQEAQGTTADLDASERFAAVREA